jgi:hypothetical protein
VTNCDSDDGTTSGTLRYEINNAAAGATRRLPAYRCSLSLLGAAARDLPACELRLTRSTGIRLVGENGGAVLKRYSRNRSRFVRICTACRRACRTAG